MAETSWYRGLCRKLQTPKIPPAITPSTIMLGIAILLSIVIAMSQGLDYIVRPSETAVTLTVLESKFPLDFWGIVFVTFAGIALVGTVFEFWPAAILGHGVLAVNYFAIGSGVVWSLIDDWKGYGWNTGVIYLCFATFHYLVADGCYDEWAKEWRKPPPPLDLVMGEDANGQSDL